MNVDSKSRKMQIIILFFSAQLLNAESLEFKKLHKKVNYSREVVASTYLIEKGKAEGTYEPQKVYDISRKTSWCTNKNNGIGENLYIPFWNGFEYSYKHYNMERDQIIIFSIHNGFGGGSDLYEKNSRIKRIKVEIQELATTPVSYEQEATAEFPILILHGPVTNSVHEIVLRDQPTEQLHEIRIKLNVPKNDAKFGQPDLFFKVTILEIYPGTKYKDLCASEMSFYNKGLIPKYKD
jgi:hypothetical protein